MRQRSGGARRRVGNEREGSDLWEYVAPVMKQTHMTHFREKPQTFALFSLSSPTPQTARDDKVLFNIQDQNNFPNKIHTTATEKESTRIEKEDLGTP